MQKQERLSSEEVKRLLILARKKDWDATVALLAERIKDTVENYELTAKDHRYVQGKVHALKDLFKTITGNSY